MKKIKKALFLCAICASTAAAQFSAGGDSVYTVPAKPTTKDSITYNFLDSDACCCAQFVNPTVSVVDTMVHLSFSVNTAPCQTCRCLALPGGARCAFKGGPLKAGTYAIYRVQSFYCPPGTVCPMIVILPVRIGAVVVTGPASAEQAVPKVAQQGKMALTWDRNSILMDYRITQPIRVRVNVFDARGCLATEVYNGDASQGAYRYSWKAPKAGVYIMSVEINGIQAASRKVIVSQ